MIGKRPQEVLDCCRYMNESVGKLERFIKQHRRFDDGELLDAVDEIKGFASRLDDLIDGFDDTFNDYE